MIQSAPAVSRLRFLLTGPLVLILAVLALWIWNETRAEAPAPPSLAQGEQQTRRVEVTLADVEASWGRILRDAGRAAYIPVTARFFVSRAPNPCAAGRETTGPFYCADDQTLRFDLGFLTALTPQLAAIEDMGGKLIIAQIAAAPLQDQLGILAEVKARGREATPAERLAMTEALALQADCLTGLWAREAASRIGPVPAGRYALSLQGARSVIAAQMPWRAAPLTAHLFGPGTPVERETAFQMGYVTGALETCLAMDPAGAGQ